MKFSKQQVKKIEESNLELEKEKAELKDKKPLTYKRKSCIPEEVYEIRKSVIEAERQKYTDLPFEADKEFANPRYISVNGNLRAMSENEENYLKFYDGFKIIKNLIRRTTVHHIKRAEYAKHPTLCQTKLVRSRLANQSEERLDAKDVESKSDIESESKAELLNTNKVKAEENNKKIIVRNSQT